MDAYHAPYAREHRYWTGLLLLLRCALFLVFAFNVLGDDSTNLLAIATVMFALGILTRYSGRIYMNKFLDVLEASFIFNLGILATATYHVKETGGNQAAAAYTSVSVALFTFIGILLYHIYIQIKDTSAWKTISGKHHRYRLIPFGQNNEDPLANDNDQDNITDSGDIPLKSPSTTYVDRQNAIRAPSTTFVELREPILDDQ